MMGRLALAGFLLMAAAPPAAATDWLARITIPEDAVLLSIGDALKAGLNRNPDLLNSADSYLSARVSEAAARASFWPQVTPFFSTNASQIGVAGRQDEYGVNLTQQFSFGPSIQGSALLDRSRVGGVSSYVSDYQISLAQPLLRNADPAVPAEPLREARRATQLQALNFETARRRAVVAIYQAYLGVAEQEQALEISVDHAERSRRLTEFSRARFLAGSVSRLDVLRAQQQEAQANVAVNDARNAVEDARDFLRRTAGLPKDYRFCVRPPEELPESEPNLDDALGDVLARRPEVVEGRAEILDAEFALRIARSAQLPSLDAVLSYERTGSGTTSGQALRPETSSLVLGFRSDYGLNPFQLSANRRQTEIALASKRRNEAVLEEDVLREVKQAYRRLDALSLNYEIAADTARVAELQSRVAQLRFEKGLSDNFNVVDAENQLNSNRLFELSARYDILLARLDCLLVTSTLDPNRYLLQP